IIFINMHFCKFFREIPVYFPRHHAGFGIPAVSPAHHLWYRDRNRDDHFPGLAPTAPAVLRLTASAFRASMVPACSASLVPAYPGPLPAPLFSPASPGPGPAGRWYGTPIMTSTLWTPSVESSTNPSLLTRPSTIICDTPLQEPSGFLISMLYTAFLYLYVI